MSWEPQIRAREPFLWLNEHWQPFDKAEARVPLGLADMEQAEDRLRRFAPLLMRLFPELEASQGLIESPLLPTSSRRQLIKADHALPVAGSIKARGGIYEVLWHAED